MNTSAENLSSFFSDSEQIQSLGFPLHYRILATIVHILIFLCGVFGNILVVILVHKNRSLQSSTYKYLVSLAFADLIVLISAVPEAIVVHHIGNQWLIGQVGCSIFIFFNFLGINAGSLSILGFTIEQYAVVCMQSKASVWFSEHTKQMVISLWLFSVTYCSPWFGLTEVRADPIFLNRQRCDLRLSRQAYRGLFGADFLLFYAIPLIVAIVCYASIGLVLLRTARVYSWESPKRGSLRPASIPPVLDEESSSSPGVVLSAVEKQLSVHTSRWRPQPQSHKQVLRMLVTVVVIFAITWLPFRGLLIYNSFATQRWNNLWYMFFAKTMIYLNSAINPFLYNAMSPRFRMAASLFFNYKTSKKRSVRYAHCSGARVILT